MADLDRVIVPGVTHWQSPDFYAFFPSNNSGPSILGELLSAGLAVQGMMWTTSPAATELETHVMDWLIDMLGLPEAYRSSGTGGGVIQDTASSASLCALIAARERATDFAVNESGGNGRLVAYTSNQAHSSIEKAVRIAGIGSDNLRLIDVDETFAMRPEALSAQIETDRGGGLVPAFVCATVGTTSSNGIDPVTEIGRICRDNGLWLHVDAAMSGTAAICPEYRYLNDGLELADSYCFNPHKWMFTNFDCDCFWVADRAALIKSLSILPDYLRNRASESGAVIDYRDWQVPLGRRFRALKLWMVIRHYGIEGLQHHVRRHIELAQQLAGQIRESEGFELAVEPPLNLVLLPPRRRRRAQRAAPRQAERERQPLYDAHDAQRAIHIAPVRRAARHGGTARATRLGANPVDGGRAGLAGCRRRSAGRIVPGLDATIVALHLIQGQPRKLT